jgi:hypothetical protein
MTNKISKIYGICLFCLIPANISWQGHFCRIMRRHDSFEKQYSDKAKGCGIERLQDDFNIY